MPLAPAPTHPRRLVFLGTPAFAATPLRGLVDAGFEVVLAVSQPDRKRGRGGALVPSPVKLAAAEAGIPTTDAVDAALGVGADLGVVVAFGRIIKPHVLAELPMVNLHFSLLPRWRGAAPVERAILAGDERTGVDLMVVEEGLDTGAVYDRYETAIGPDDTAAYLRERLAEAGSRLLVDNLVRGLGQPTPQRGEPTYAHKVDPAELRVDWSRPAIELHRLVRIGGAWTTHEGSRLKLWATALDERPGSVAVPAGDGALHLLEVQPEGKRRMPAAAWANGAHWHPGDKLGG